MKEIYDSHTELEVVHLIIKLFNLELKNNDSIALAYIKITGVKIYVTLTPYIKALYPTYSYYPYLLRESGKVNEIFFGSIEKKFVERKNDFGKKTTPQSPKEVVCIAQK